MHGARKVWYHKNMLLSVLRHKEFYATLALFALVSVFILVQIITGAFLWPFFFLVVLAAAVLILQNPRVGLLSIVLLTMIWEHFFTLQPLVFDGFAFKLYLLDIFLALTVIAFLVHWFVERHHRKLLHDPKAPSPLLLRSFGTLEKLLVVFALFATAYFLQAQVAFGVESREIAFSSYKAYAFYPLLTFLVIGLLRTREQFVRLMATLLFGGALIAVFVIIGLVRGRGLWIELTLPLSTEGVRYLAFPHAYYLSIALIVALNLWAHRILPWPRTALAFMALQLVGIVGSLFRHLWIAVAGAIFFLMLSGERRARKHFLQWGQRLLVAILLVVLLLSATTFFFPESRVGIVSTHFLDALVARVASFGNVTEDISALWRLRFWQTILQSFYESPVFGIGFGQQISFDVRGWVSAVFVRDVHNSLLGLLVQMGIVGAGLFLAMQILCIVGYARARRRLGWIRPFADGIFVSYLAFFIAANFQLYLETNLLNIFFWMMLGIIRVAPTLTEAPSIDWSHLRFKRHLQILESTHPRGTTVFR